MADKLTPSDPRVTHHTATVRGKTYHYLLAVPTGGRAVTGTIVLVHGFPDLGFGWRYQVPLLAEQLGLQVIVPDMLGYGQTDAPDAIEPYTQKSMCADLVALVDHVGVVDQPTGQPGRFFVGGHDWGGFTAWRMLLWHPERLRGVFSVCTPYMPPSSSAFGDLATVTERFPNFRYQLQFASDAVTDAVQRDETRIRQFLSAMYGGRTADGTPTFTTAAGVRLDLLDAVLPPRLLSAPELDYYVAEFARHGMRGPTNWYRTLRLNHEDEHAFVGGGSGSGSGGGKDDANKASKITVPSLMVVAENDIALPPVMAERMDKYFDRLTRVTVPGSHWALWQSADLVNEHIKAFLTPLLGASKASI